MLSERWKVDGFDFDGRYYWRDVWFGGECGGGLGY